MNDKYSKIRWFFLLAVLLFIPLTLQAQQDSSEIQNKILNSKESDLMFIQRTRDFIISSLKAGNISDASEAYHYTRQKYSNSSFKPFWLADKLLLSYWFGEYHIIYKADSIEYDMEKNGSEYLNRGDYHYPQQDELELELMEVTKENRSEIIKQIDSLVTDDEKHDYLVLFFDWFTNGAVADEYASQEDLEYLEKVLTPRAEDFLARYNNSIFRPFVMKHFRYVYELNDIGFGYYLGLGSLIPQNIAAQYLNPEASIGLGFDISWKSILFDVGLDVGIPEKVRKPFFYDGKTWNTDISHNYYTYYLTSGWVIEESGSFKIIPHIGIGGINMSVCEEDQDKAGGDYSMTEAAVQYGITCDIKMDLFSFFFKRDMHTYSGIRLGFDYYQFLGNNPIMSGGMMRFRVSVVGFTRALIRVL